MTRGHRNAVVGAPETNPTFRMVGEIDLRIVESLDWREYGGQKSGQDVEMFS